MLNTAECKIIPTESVLKSERQNLAYVGLIHKLWNTAIRGNWGHLAYPIFNYFLGHVGGRTGPIQNKSYLVKPSTSDTVAGTWIRQNTIHSL